MISIIINCHNCLDYLSEALDSVVAQTEQDWEIIFWDNASDVPAKNFIEQYNDTRIRYYFDSNFSLLGEARNRALNQAQGDFIAFLDADDYWMPEKLGRQKEIFHKNHNIGLVYSDANIIFEGKPVKQVFSRMAPPEGEVFGQLLGSYFLVMSSVMIRRSALDSLTNWFNPKFEIIEEYDLFLRIAADWEFACSNDVLAVWRWYDSSTTMKKRRLISREKRLFLKQLYAQFPDKMTENKDQVDKVKGKILVSRALAEYYAYHPSHARRILRYSTKWSVKGVFVYLASILPVDLVDRWYRRIWGNPLV